MSPGRQTSKTRKRIAQKGLLDTSTVIAIETNREVDFGALPLEQYVSAFTIGELHAGIHSAPDVDSRAARVASLDAVTGLQTLGVDSAAAAHWGRMRAKLNEAGRRINVNDLWIASVALAHDMPVVTQDSDFDLLLEFGGPEVIKV